MVAIKLLVVSHALVQEVSRARWRRLAEGFPVEVTLVVPSHWESTHFGQRVTWSPARVDESGYHVLPLMVSNTQSWERYSFLSLTAGLRWSNPDVIYVLQDEVTVVLRQLMAYRRIWAPKARLIFFTWNNLRIPGRLKLSRFWWWLVRNHTDMAVAGNTEVKQVLQRANYDKPIVVQPEIGVDESIFHQGGGRENATRLALDLKGFVIGYAGRLIEAKGIRDLLAAATGMEDVTLLLVGDGPLRPGIVEFAERNGMVVKITGQIDPHQMPAHLRAMDCLVLPSRTTELWKEQFGLVLAEAMLCQVPVIGSDSGAIPEVIGDAGLVFPEGNTAALRDCISQLKRHPDLRLGLAQRGYDRALLHYSAKGLAAETYELLGRFASYGN